MVCTDFQKVRPKSLMIESQYIHWGFFFHSQETH